MRTMPASVESSIRNRIIRERGSIRWGLGRRVWALAGAAVMAVAVVGLLLMRQQPVTAAEIVAQADAKLDGISTYHTRYKLALPGPDGQDYVSYYEDWYKAPDKLRSVLTQPGSTMIQVVRGNSQLMYSKEDDVAFVTPVSDRLLDFYVTSPVVARSPKDMLKEFGDGYRYAGTDRVGKLECDVIEGDFPNDRHIRACIDRKTGILLQYVITEKGKVVVRDEIDTLEVNKPIPDNMFESQLPPNTLLVKATVLSSELLGMDLSHGIEGLPNSIKEPYRITSELRQLAEQGSANHADLKNLYEPGYIPSGYKLVGVGTYGKRHDMPDGTYRVDFTGGYDRIYIDYINPQTGDTILIVESAKELKGFEGTEVSSGDFDGRIATHTEPFSYTQLMWQRDDEYFFLSASTLGEQETIKIAQSLHLLRVPAEPPVEP